MKTENKKPEFKKVTFNFGAESRWQRSYKILTTPALSFTYDTQFKDIDGYDFTDIGVIFECLSVALYFEVSFRHDSPQTKSNK